MTALTTLATHPRSDPAETLAKAQRLIDPDSGIIQVLYEAPNDPDVPAVFGYGSHLADTAQYGVEDFGLVNGSTSMVRERAAAGAVGEAVERYAARLVPYGDLIWGSTRQLAPEAVEPRAAILYDDEQHSRPRFPYRRLLADDPIAWVWGQSLATGRERLVPATLVFMHSVEEGVRPFVQQTTNGLACGNTLEEAILSGLYEVVERDASMMAWLTRRSAPHLDPTAATDTGLRSVLAAFRRARVEVDLVDITTDVEIPCVLATASIGHRHGGAPVFATAANLSPQGAARRALEELAQCIPWVRVLVANVPQTKPMDQLSATEDHVLWPSRPAERRRVGFLTASPDTVDLARLPDRSTRDVLTDIRTCVGQLWQRGLDVLVVDITPPDIAEVGLHVTRTIVLGAQPLYFGSGLWRVGPRAQAAAEAGGVAINHVPHPFP